MAARLSADSLIDHLSVLACAHTRAAVVVPATKQGAAIEPVPMEE
jgi:hypothetical protein